MCSISRTVFLIDVFLINVFIQVVQSGCGKKSKNNKEEDDDCWYQLWYFWLIVGLFLTGAAVIVFFYCQQYAKNARIERRGRCRSHQMVLPPAPPSYEEPGHHPPPYHIALTESTVPDGHVEVFHHPYENTMQLQEVTGINENRSEIRPQSVPPPYSLVDHRNNNNNNNRGSNTSNSNDNSYFQALSIHNAGGNSLLQLHSQNPPTYTYNSTTSAIPSSAINSVSNHQIICPYWNGSGIAVGHLSTTDNVFLSNNINEARVSGQLASTPMDHQVQIQQYCELPPYESRPQSGVQGANREPGINVSVIESSLTTRIAVLTGPQILGVHSSSRPNANANTFTNGRGRNAQTSNRQNPTGRTGTNSVAPNQHRRVSLPQTRSNRNAPISVRRSLSSETNVGPAPNQIIISRLNGVRQTQNGQSLARNQTAKVGLLSQAKSTPASASANNVTPRTRTRTSTSTNVTPRSTATGNVANTLLNSTNSVRRTHPTQPRRQSVISGVQWSRRFSDQGSR